LMAANRRYLEFISAIEDDRAGTDKLNKVSQPVQEKDRRICQEFCVNAVLLVRFICSPSPFDFAMAWRSGALRRGFCGAFRA
jgi:hypothetical protein